MEPDPLIADLGFARVDVDRARRTGDAEVVYGAGKTPGQVIAILRTLHERHPDRAVLATRLSEEALAQVATSLPGASVDAVAR
ncbi:MAG TPA: 1-(5-phosphoribosyl)-5-amino-4-imidazole-carboxylate carboxylase, partial [Nocardioides sp.]|nr:1-(5-phosphoribosyl)-5-amino-4-imidazole-carboxylate carboxylase [Nocardioides sp.]